MEVKPSIIGVDIIFMQGYNTSYMKFEDRAVILNCSSILIINLGEVHFMRAVITVIGKDKVGIIAAISNVLAECNVNILDISQTTMQDVFTMIMLVDIGGLNIDFSELSGRLEKKGEEIGLSVRIQHEDIFNSMHRI